MDTVVTTCEQCGLKPSVLYCLTCAKHICVDCEESHSLTHNVVSTGTSLKCQQHRLPFDLYCESCEMLICNTCYGLHFSQHHVLSPIQQVFRKKQSIIVSLMSQTAFEKKAAIQAQAGRISKRITDLRGFKSVIEGDVNQYMDQILVRLETWTTPMAQKLEKERLDIARDLTVLDSALRVIDSPDKLQFLSEYRSVIATLDSLAAKPIYAETEVSFGEIPREMQELRSRVQESNMQKVINQARNDVAWDMLRSYPEDKESSDAAAKREILQWSRLTDKLLQQVADLQFVCYFCKAPLSLTNINAECPMNPVGKIKPELSRDPLIPPALLGNGFHYVVSPRDDLKKQVESWKFYEPPKSKAKIEENAGGLSRRTPRVEETGRKDPRFSESSYARWTENRPSEERDGMWKAMDPYPEYNTGAGTGRKQTSPAPRPYGLSSRPQTDIDPAKPFSFRTSELPQNPSKPDQSRFQTSAPQGKDSSRTGSKGRVSSEQETDLPNKRFTFGTDSKESVRYSESFGSFNPVNSFGATQEFDRSKPAPKATAERPGKEVRFSYSDMYQTPANPTVPRQSETLQTVKPGPRSSLTGTWRDHVKSALTGSSGAFLSACKAFDNGAGEIPIDGLRVSLHKSSTMLTMEDIDQAAQYAGRDRVNYSSFFSAMTQG